MLKEKNCATSTCEGFTRWGARDVTEPDTEALLTVCKPYRAVLVPHKPSAQENHVPPHQHSPQTKSPPCINVRMVKAVHNSSIASPPNHISCVA